MPELTRRRYPERQDCWHVYFGDVRVDTIAIRTGVPHHEDPWGWICGFYPGSAPGEYLDGTAATFDQARVDFEAAWRIFLSKRTGGIGPSGSMQCGKEASGCRRRSRAR
jgi:hypothetical protein